MSSMVGLWASHQEDAKLHWSSMRSVCVRFVCFFLRESGEGIALPVFKIHELLFWPNMAAPVSMQTHNTVPLSWIWSFHVWTLRKIQSLCVTMQYLLFGWSKDDLCYSRNLDRSAGWVYWRARMVSWWWSILRVTKGWFSLCLLSRICCCVWNPVFCLV